ncbi:MAG: DUF393 domain-containing protein [Pseudomonadota bacterium]
MSYNGAPLIVFYNTLCPVCNAGIDYQQNKLIVLVKAGEVEFRDINLEPERLSEFGATLEHIRKRLHATRGADMIVGADVAIEIWRITSGQKWLALLFGNPAIRPLTRLGYNLFAELLYAWNKWRGSW